MKRIAKLIGLGVSFLLLICADVTQQAPFGITVGREAAAIIGMPMTPMSVAGVARRTTRRTVAASSANASATAAQQAQTEQPTPAAVAPGGPPPVGTIVTTLPPGCATTVLNNVEYHRCGSTYYRAAMQGSNLVFVVSQP